MKSSAHAKSNIVTFTEEGTNKGVAWILKKVVWTHGISYAVVVNDTATPSEWFAKGLSPVLKLTFPDFSDIPYDQQADAHKRLSVARKQARKMSQEKNGETIAVIHLQDTARSTDDGPATIRRQPSTMCGVGGK